MGRAATGGELGLDGAKAEGTWSDRRKDIVAAWHELVGLRVARIGIGIASQLHILHN